MNRQILDNFHMMKEMNIFIEDERGDA
ncbi:hypothetical protein NMYAN_60054 [Nitrosomonas nitrosa]|uniref:Uncharacterized protein n=1 Tax=Nitrosomonas nitrosa TaxID=52442 RepID=A0A8H8Z2T2_9PROT|nr:hypothetical protein NMYAN_60054 [Nitrosomonas nitrosa]